MSSPARILSVIFTSLPALIFGAIILNASGWEYFWRVYQWSWAGFLLASLGLGYFGPQLFRARWGTRPWLWISVQSGWAWMVAILLMALLHTTSLCVGQDNGDGNNDLTICMVQGLLAVMLFSPLELVLLGLSALGANLAFRSIKPSKQRA